MVFRRFFHVFGLFTYTMIILNNNMLYWILIQLGEFLINSFMDYYKNVYTNPNQYPRKKNVFGYPTVFKSIFTPKEIVQGDQNIIHYENIYYLSTVNIILLFLWHEILITPYTAAHTLLLYIMYIFSLQRADIRII